MEEIEVWNFSPEDLKEAIIEETMGEPEAYASEINFMKNVQLKAQKLADDRPVEPKPLEDEAHDELIEKLINEKNELVERLEKLTNFINDDEFEEIVEIDTVRTSMEEQHICMTGYLRELAYRIGMLS